MKAAANHPPAADTACPAAISLKKEIHEKTSTSGRKIYGGNAPDLRTRLLLVKRDQRVAIETDNSLNDTTLGEWH